MSGLDFLVPVLQSSNSFDLNAFFQVLFSLIRTVCRGNVNLLLSESLRSTVLLCKVENLFSVLFRSEASNGFPVKSVFSENFSVKLIFGRSFIFCTFVCNHGVLNLRLQVLALPASVTMAQPTKTSQKLKIYRLDSPDRIFRQL